ncbi:MULTISPECIES: DUF2794 domain-containing protein [Sphingomonadaceae]|jgi:hypothetical protein|uniref:DUF2794 domain-containing protein n=1 Tax=Novosphingobium resinovorum TaxID=158500 RepID=A0A031K1X6_9SPHN|nr:MULTISPECIES: DUF2794 domain-containing protein [Sphingomonadaceae]AOR76271.1 hypothetical protein BES08_05485 [Novosphingobium resinovorum]EJU14261.1 hypothetical protein LH128_04669 [Sphingomonas sp. LH128]EZP83220.1 hypothetical protein BV97_01326 [Novosphingobium resinovorum]MBF7011683.1 DUF2794 domain-containing protein [Novosphingobium sp. HR1a]WJM26436.1 DUF2794 domain-containing protein [Novosphingobium resinovorum]
MVAGGITSGSVVPFPGVQPSQVGFDRLELQRILDLYGRMVAAGLWRDYAMDFAREAASFSAFRRAAERPQARIEKRPSLRGKQGMWTLFGEAGQVLKRGHELSNVLSSLERKLLKVVED